MKEVKISIRCELEKGLSYSGTEEVNDLLSKGWRVLSVEGPSAWMKKTGEKDGMVSMYFAGSDLRFTMEPPLVTQP
jgi:hypothetical protein